MFLSIKSGSAFFRAIEQRDEATLHSMLEENPSLVSIPARLMKPLVLTLGNNHITPIQCAAQLGCNEIIDLLWRRGANIAERNSEGLSTLLFAVIGGQKETIDYLLQYHGDKCNLNEKNLHGFSALMCALWSGQIEVAMHLLCHYSHCIDVDDTSHAAFKQAMDVLWGNTENKAEAIAKLYANKLLMENYAHGLTLTDLLKEMLWRTSEPTQKERLVHFSKQLEFVLTLKSTQLHETPLEQIVAMIHWPNVTSLIKGQDGRLRHSLLELILEKQNIDALVKLIIDGVISANEILEYIGEAKNAHYGELGYFALALANHLDGQWVVSQNMLIFMPIISAYLKTKPIYSDNAKWLAANYRIACPISSDDPAICYLDLAAPAPIFNLYESLRILRSLSDRDKDKHIIIKRLENDSAKLQSDPKKRHSF